MSWCSRFCSLHHYVCPISMDLVTTLLAGQEWATLEMNAICKTMQRSMNDKLNKLFARRRRRCMGRRALWETSPASAHGWEMSRVCQPSR